MPWMDSVWVKNKLMSHMRPAKWSPMVQFANKREEERRAMPAADKDKNDRDFLSRFVAAMEKDPSIPPWHVSPQPPSPPRFTCSARPVTILC